MNNKQALWTSLVIEGIGWIVLFCVNWKIAVSVLCVMWGKNISDKFL